jgi:hypothetical protein
MSKIKNLSGMGWFIAGVAVTLLVLPGVAEAAGLKFTGIESTSNNKAAVSAAGQLLTTAATPASFYQSSFANYPGAFPTYAAVTRPAPADVVVTDIHIGTYSPPPSGNTTLDTFIGNSSCTSSYGSFALSITPTFGQTDIPINPGFLIPKHDVVCAAQVSAADNVILWVSGYTVPSGDVSSTAALRPFARSADPRFEPRSR